MTQEHSPGPWHIQEERVRGTDWGLPLAVVRAADDDLVCEIPYPDHPAHMANGQLIASAPALLAEVERLRHRVDLLTWQYHGEDERYCRLCFGLYPNHTTDCPVALGADQP